MFESINRLDTIRRTRSTTSKAPDWGLNAFPFVYNASDEPDLAPSKERIYPDPDRVLAAWSRRFLDGLPRSTRRTSWRP